MEAVQKLQRFLKQQRERAKSRSAAAALQAAAQRVADQMKRFGVLLRSGMEVSAFLQKGKPAKRFLWLHSNGALFLTSEKQMGEVRKGTKPHVKFSIPLEDVTSVTCGADADAFTSSSQRKAAVRGKENHASVLGSASQPERDMQLVSSKRAIIVAVTKPEVAARRADERAMEYRPRRLRATLRHAAICLKATCW